MEQQKAVVVRNLECNLGERTVLGGINLELHRGGFYAVLGPNGSGKTTLLRHIAKSIEPQVGVVLINDTDLTGLSPQNLARQLAVVPQHTVIEFEFSVLEIVIMGRAPYRTGWFGESETDLRVVQQAMELTDTWHLRERSIRVLSGGERQRVIIARAIAQQTGIILLDEPVSHLDIYHQLQLLKQLKVLNREQGITVLAVLHDLNLAAAFCQKLILMYQGRVFRQGTAEEVLQVEVVRDVYGVEVQIIRNPETGKPFLIPMVGG